MITQYEYNNKYKIKHTVVPIKNANHPTQFIKQTHIHSKNTPTSVVITNKYSSPEKNNKTIVSAGRYIQIQSNNKNSTSTTDYRNINEFQEQNIKSNTNKGTINRKNRRRSHIKTYYESKRKNNNANIAIIKDTSAESKNNTQAPMSQEKVGYTRYELV